MTETIELHDIDEMQFKAIMQKLHIFYGQRKSWYQSGVTPVFQKFGETDELLYGVHVFVGSDNRTIYLVLSEYYRGSQMAMININSSHYTGIFGRTENRNGEIMLREALEAVTYEELDSYVNEIIIQEQDVIFNCPNCRAQYKMRALRISDDGRVECANCAKTYDPIELDVAQRSASHDS